MYSFARSECHLNTGIPLARSLEIALITAKRSPDSLRPFKGSPQDKVTKGRSIMGGSSGTGACSEPSKKSGSCLSAACTSTAAAGDPTGTAGDATAAAGDSEPRAACSRSSPKSSHMSGNADGSSSRSLDASALAEGGAVSTVSAFVPGPNLSFCHGISEPMGSLMVKTTKYFFLPGTSWP